MSDAISIVEEEFRRLHKQLETLAAARLYQSFYKEAEKRIKQRLLEETIEVDEHFVARCESGVST